jgi:hypothetical protein
MAEGIAADEEQRRVLTETLPPGTVADSVIRKLECSKRRFLESRANRRSNKELKAERKKWQNRIKAWIKVQEVEEPEWWNTAALVRGRVEEAAIRIDQISAAIQAFARRHDPDLELVYFDILCTWVGRGLQLLRQKADQIGTRNAFNDLRDQHRLGDKHFRKEVVSRLLKVMDNLEAVEAWRATLTEKQRLEWASPDTLVRRARSSTSPRRRRQKQGRRHTPSFSKPMPSYRSNYTT